MAAAMAANAHGFISKLPNGCAAPATACHMLLLLVMCRVLLCPLSLCQPACRPACWPACLPTCSALEHGAPLLLIPDAPMPPHPCPDMTQSLANAAAT